MGHWDETYAARPETGLTWFEDRPVTSLALIDKAELPKGAAVVDVGAGASRLAGALIARGAGHVTLIDLSEDALNIAMRHVPAGASLSCVVGDVTEWVPDRAYDLWHDRAAFHFLVQPEQQDRYIAALHKALKPGGLVVLATFAPDGPATCSNLPVMHYDDTALAARLGARFTVLDSLRHVHVTPKGNEQPFTYLLAQRRED
ncbi:class I SAM-dependent methyltransferase [Lutimaribacter sp. EGI FJ00015]|uniref:Class I SAM-dependent methyltransferase n=1 Tax=Lutimaribacter degradans TaxID=2945989 RepID=A0ACC5ZRP3_9RHOB|nr:class I SAM-dependent methyltransferase [Lutimaribacter sp. EGI FJ00013]MCM2560966.1 class I SAM-dependent methyltransferase [Lutimaribacter sp. EGI FJ00013]MCO0612088.1 class I SAM-dependent methyltransferase [Lutimaribacter sp. EGI FJ00015]MCO0634792.1 class I SAM-dependent methyltransferase [Lutimaribacter sp. EGI FJ00014]